MEDLRVPRGPVLFVLFELVLLAAIPIIGYVGVEALLDTRAGNFVVQPTPADPGWLAAVDPSPVTGVVEVVDGRVSGVSIVAQQSAIAPGGTVIFVWPTTLIDGRAIGEMAPEVAVAAVARELKIQIPVVEILDEQRWGSVLGGETRLVENPDPVRDPSGELLLEVGSVEIDASLAAAFIGLEAANGNPDGVIVRRTLWWRTLLEDPPDGEDDLAALLRALGSSHFNLVDLPTEISSSAGGPIVDLVAGEALVLESIPFPASNQPGDRLRVRVLDRVGGLDLEAVARSLTGQGFEVVQIGNVEVFGDGPAEVVVPEGVTDPRIEALAQLYGAATVYPSASSGSTETEGANIEGAETESAAAVEIVTLIVGSSVAEMSTP